jgi:hypothetical protein
LDPESKRDYDSVGDDAIYLGNMEREELARVGLLKTRQEESDGEEQEHWTCVTTPGFLPGEDTDAWVDLCWQVAPAVGYRGKIRVAVLEGGRHWPGDPSSQWDILLAGSYTFAAFQRGVEPNRLHALSAMIKRQSHLQKQGAQAQDRERTT